MSYAHAESMRGHVAIVTGAAQGVGKGIAAALLDRGAAVLLVDIQAEVLAATTAELQPTGRVEQLVADLRDPDSAQRIVSAAVDAFGTVHGLVNNAIATNEPKAFVDITIDDLALGHDVGPRATFLLMQAVQPLMVEAGGGSIVNLGSARAPAASPGGLVMQRRRKASAGCRRSLLWNGAGTTSGSTSFARSPSPTASNCGSSTPLTTTPKRSHGFP